MTDVKVIQGIHKSEWGLGLVVTIQYQNGLKQERVWGDNTVMRPYLVDVLLDDLQLTGELREAVKQYCLGQIKEWDRLTDDPEHNSITEGILAPLVEGFIDGWKAARGQQEPERL